MKAGRTRTFTAGADLAAFLRVKLNSSGQVVAAGAGEVFDGVTINDVKSGEPVAVELVGGGQTYEVTADGAISVGATIYGCASGKVSATSTSNGFPIGKAYESATADGSIIEAALFGNGLFSNAA